MTQIDPPFDVLVLGAGPGGYAAAIRAAQLGLRSGLVERTHLGGVCLNLGCIPSKAMLRSAELLSGLANAEELGIRIEGMEPNYPAAVARRDRVVDHLRQGLANLIKSNAISVIHGAGSLIDAHTMHVEGPDGQQEIAFHHLIIATGSSPAGLPIPGADLDGVIDSNGALALQEAPRRVVVIGAGAVGVEWADVWQAFGSEVTILELLPRLVSTEDPEISRELARAFGRKGIICHTTAEVREIRRIDPETDYSTTPPEAAPPSTIYAAPTLAAAMLPREGRAAPPLNVVAVIDGKECTFPAEVVLTAIGRRPNVADLNLSAAGVQWSPRGITVDGQMRTSIPNIFAIGDVTGTSLLAHAATHQAMIVVGAIAGGDPEPFDSDMVPAAIFTSPEIASVGLREADAKERGIPIQVARFPFAALGRAVAAGDPSGFVKMLAREDDGKIVGVHIVGGHAGDLIGEAALALRLGATLHDFAATMHVHPTFSEALLETAWVALGTPLHVPPRRRRAATPEEATRSVGHYAGAPLTDTTRRRTLS